MIWEASLGVQPMNVTVAVAASVVVVTLVKTKFSVDLVK